MAQAMAVLPRTSGRQALLKPPGSRHALGTGRGPVGLGGLDGGLGGPDSPRPPALSEHFPSVRGNTPLETKVKRGRGPVWGLHVGTCLCTVFPSPPFLRGPHSLSQAGSA